MLSEKLISPCMHACMYSTFLQNQASNLWQRRQVENALLILSIGNIQQKDACVQGKHLSQLACPPACILPSCKSSNQRKGGQVEKCHTIFLNSRASANKTRVSAGKDVSPSLPACVLAFIPSRRSSNQGRLKNAKPVHGFREPQPKKA